MDQRISGIRELVQNIIEKNEDLDINWVLLSAALTPSGSGTPIIRSPELLEMLSLALNPSTSPKFRELVFKQLQLQMSVDGAKEFVVRFNIVICNGCR